MNAKREIKAVKFSYAVHIQPRNGQELTEFRGGISLRPRPWNSTDARRFPQAENAIISDRTMLVVDIEDTNVYLVDVQEFADLTTD